MSHEYPCQKTPDRKKAIICLFVLPVASRGDTLWSWWNQTWTKCLSQAIKAYNKHAGWVVFENKEEQTDLKSRGKQTVKQNPKKINLNNFTEFFPLISIAREALIIENSMLIQLQTLIWNSENNLNPNKFPLLFVEKICCCFPCNRMIMSRVGLHTVWKPLIRF